MHQPFQLTDSNGTLLFYYKSKNIEEGYRDKLNCYDELKIVHILDGQGIWEINGFPVTFSKGDFLLFSRADLRSIKALNSPLVTIEQIGFVPAFLMPLQEVCGFFSFRPEGFNNLIASTHSNYPAISQCFCALLNSMHSKELFLRQAVCAKLALLCIEIAKACNVTYQMPSAKERQTTVEHAMQYIQSAYREDLTLEAVAGRFYLSPAYFSRLFTKYCGMTFQNYLTRIRILKVIELLENSSLNILDAAYQCGFSSSSGFYKAFKQMTGVTPKKFKRKG